MNRYTGSILGSSLITPNTATASGMWSLNHAMQYSKSSSWPTPPSGDLYYTSVSLLLHGDGTFTDSSQYSTALTTVNGATTSNTTYKFGSGSLNFTPTSAYASFSNSNMNFGTGDWTIELWWYHPASVPNYGVIFDLDGNNTLFVGFSSDSSALRVYSSPNGINYNTSAHGMTTGNWYHLAWVRSGSTITIYRDGVSYGSVAAGSTAYTPAASTAYISTYGAPAGTFQAGGHIDEFRITKGVARYTSNFTPPTAAFSNTSGGGVGGGGLTTSGLVLNLDAGNASSYSGTGSTWTDLTGSGRSATLVNSPTYSATNGGYLAFNGTNQYATFNAGTPGTTMTVEMWVYFYETQPNGYGMYFSWNQYDVFDYQASGGIGYNTFNGDVYGISHATATSSVRNAWKHMIFEMRSDVSYTNNKIYVNKISQTLSQQTGTENATNRIFNGGVGQIAAAGGSYIGKMGLGSFRVYNRALTQAEIDANYDYQKSRYGLS